MSTSSRTRRWTIPATCWTRSWSQGQVQGSLANGLGQALTENAVYDRGSGQLVSGSFMDYGMPRAHNMPVELREAVHSVPSTTNPLGVKGTGEAGTTAAIAAVMNAIAHAIPNGAADHMEMPATPAKVWEACQRGLAASEPPLSSPRSWDDSGGSLPANISLSTFSRGWRSPCDRRRRSGLRAR